MTVNIEIKGNLAKLLATENLLIEHKNVETASFDVERRVLTLPQWKIDSDYVYDMLVAHEVGHALHTPNRNYKLEDKYKDLPHDYVNVVEDARIEKLMKQRFAGLNKDFYKGYEELHSINFFEVDDNEINDLKLIDRVNLYFKIGAYLCIDFTDEENQLITEITQANTFDEILDLSLKMFEMGKDQKQSIDEMLKAKLVSSEKGSINGMSVDINIDDSQDDSNKTDDDDNSQVQTPSSDDENGQDSNDSSKSQLETPVEDEDEDDLDDETLALQNKAGNHGTIETSDTQKSFDGNVQSKLNDDEARETNYVTIPELNLDSVEVEFDLIRDKLNRHFITKDHISENHLEYFTKCVDAEIKRYSEHKNKSRKDVNNLVKEFEMKKSADSYSRQATSRTGMLDMNKLHTYKYNEDIFKKVTTIPEGKNHGLVFLLDWSGSMHYQLNDTVKQLFNLVWFCRKVSIPFEVYAFTNDSYRLKPNYKQDGYGYDTHKLHQVEKHGDLLIEGGFRMVQILTSSARSRDLDEMMKLLWLQTHAISSHDFAPESEFRLSGTPLNEAIIASGQIIKRLIKREKLQKCHCVILTDGEGFHSSYVEYGSDWDSENRTRIVDKTRFTARNVYPSETVIRKGSRTFTGGHNESEFTCSLLNAVKSDLPNTQFLGIRILERDYYGFYMRYARKAFETFEDMKKQNKKNGLIDFTTDTFDHWFCLSGNKLRASDELEVKEGAVKRDISTAFKKMNRGKKTNRVMVKQFINQIA